MRTNISRQQETGGTEDAQHKTILEADANVGDRQRVPVAGGVLVYEARTLGRELVGFEEVTNWDNLADALAARGHARGHVYHLPELDTVEDLERGAR